MLMMQLQSGKSIFSELLDSRMTTWRQTWIDGSASLGTFDRMLQRMRLR